MIPVNSYFDGKVKSLPVNSGPLPATVGVMLAGSYTFGTSQKEIMTVIAGELVVKLPGESSTRCFRNGQVFEVPAQASFDVTASVDTAYLCQYC